MKQCNLFLGIICCTAGILLSACSAKNGMTDSGGIDGENLKEIAEKKEAMEGISQKEEEVQLSDHIFSTGETIHTLYHLEEYDENPGLDITLHSAELFSSPQEAGLDQSQMLERTENYSVNGEPVRCYVNESRILLCRFTIKNVNHIDQYNSELHIGEISVVNKNPATGQVTLVSNAPAWFSASVSQLEKSDYYHYLVPKGESREISIAWLISSEYEPENLYICSIFDTDDENNRQYFQMNLNGEAQTE